MDLNLEDSNYLNSNVETGYRQSSAFIYAIDELHRQFVDGDIKVISLSNYRKNVELDTPVWYEIIDNTTMHGVPIVNRCRYYTSHYIGSFSYNDARIVIQPRFGAEVFNYLVGYATNLYLPLSASDIEKSNENSYWLIALLWCSMLDKALTKGQIPRSYIRETKNIKHYRGRLDISSHIRANLVDASRFYCNYPKMTSDNTINRTVRYVMRILYDKSLGAIIGKFADYDKRLASLGVQACEVSVRDIDSIIYNKLNIAYFELMQLSKHIIGNNLIQSSSKSNQLGISYFIDIAELWEMYLLKLLQRKLPEYHVYSPNINTSEYLLKEKMREIRPDVIIEKGDRVLMIVDAKYKAYRQFGKYAGENMVQREDLYQMTSYLYHYGNESEHIVGLFTAPTDCSAKQIFAYSAKEYHYIGLVNINIEEAKTLGEIHEKEVDYIKQIKVLLSSVENNLEPYFSD